MLEVPFSYPFQCLTAGGRLEGQYGPGLGKLIGYDYRVCADAERREVVIERTHLWRFTSRRMIPYHQIRAVLYGYTGPDSETRFLSARLSTYRGESFLIALRPKHGQDVTLFCYHGWAHGDTEAPSRAPPASV